MKGVFAAPIRDTQQASLWIAPVSGYARVMDAAGIALIAALVAAAVAVGEFGASQFGTRR